MEVVIQSTNSWEVLDMRVNIMRSRILELRGKINVLAGKFRLTLKFIF